METPTKNKGGRPQIDPKIYNAGVDLVKANPDITVKQLMDTLKCKQGIAGEIKRHPSYRATLPDPRAETPAGEK